jgi:hypothetical protein
MHVFHQHDPYIAINKYHTRAKSGKGHEKHIVIGTMEVGYHHSKATTAAATIGAAVIKAPAGPTAAAPV